MSSILKPNFLGRLSGACINTWGTTVWCCSSRTLSSNLKSQLSAKTHERKVLLFARMIQVRHYSKLDDPGNRKPKEPLIFVTWKSLGWSLAIAGVFLVVGMYAKNEKKKIKEREEKRAYGKIKIGGTFDLVDQNNIPRKSEDFMGKWVLIYFGFTHCPDVCPDELQKIVEVVDQVEKDPTLPNLQPIFITVDPVRDTQEIIKKYLSEFSDKFLGLTGPLEKVAQVCKAYRVYFSAGPRDVDSDYIVDHTIITYLVDPNGKFLDYYGQTKTSADIIKSIKFHVDKFEADNKVGFFQRLLS